MISNSGAVAPAGAMWSELQNTINDNSISNFTVGFACNNAGAGSYHLADDFVVPTGQRWNILSVSVYAWVSGATTNPFDKLCIEVWNGNPSLQGSSIIFSDLATNVLLNVIDTLVYGIPNTLVPAPGRPAIANNKIWKLTGNISKQLGSGRYWLDWQVHTSSGSQAWSPTCKVKGQRGLSNWNALCFNPGNAWQPAYDPGLGLAFPVLVAQDFPFEISYTY